jgi:flavin reductase (DIM6/NTAB) family NADH-FMN oxidoreductase RutF
MPSIDSHTLDSRQSYRLLTSIVTPRPIAWVSTRSPQGIANLAPFSFFNAVAGHPPTVMISIGQRAGQPKDTLANIQHSREFVINMVDAAHAEAMNLTSGDWPAEVDEFQMAGLPTAPAKVVNAPLVAGVPAALEVKATQFIPIEQTQSVMVLGQVVYFHLREGILLPNGAADTAALGLIGRLGGTDYRHSGPIFSLERPNLTPANT